MTKISLQQLHLFSYLLIVLIGAFIVFFMFSFLYKNLYQAITQSEEIIILRGSNIETVDVNKFEGIISGLEKKTVPHEFGNINNPFD
jgi:hypothetical protein